MEREIGLETVKNRAVRGVITLTGRTLVLNFVALIAQGFLWAYLTPSEFGIFWIVSAVVNFLTYFGDIGLAAALIQKKENPNETDLRTTFTVQQVLVLSLLAVLYFVSPLITNHYSLTPEGVSLLFALGFSFFLSSLKTIPSVLLERDLEFGKLVVPQILETIIYNLSIIGFAYNGFGISSFTYSVLIRGIFGLIVIYLIKPWRIGISFSLESLKHLLRFGIPYQVNTFLAVLKDDGMTAILGGILGASGMGILGTARKLAQYPLRFFMDNVTRVTFPAFSRFQGDKEKLKRSLERSIFFITFLVFPSIIGLVILAPVLVNVIPKYEKWLPAILPLAILSIDTVFAAVTTQLTNVLNATGKIKVTFWLMIMWTISAFVVIPFLSLKYGVLGAASGYALVSATSVIAIIVAKKHVDFSLARSVGKPMFATAVMGVTLLIVKKFLAINYYSLSTLVLIGCASYFATMLVLLGMSLVDDVKKVFSNIFGRT